MERLSGSNRIETAIKIIEKARTFGITNDTIYVNAFDYPDALAAGTIVSASIYSLALSDKQELPKVTADKQVVLGGTSSLPLPGYLGERIAGTNRYKTALNLANYTYPGTSFTSETIVLVDGTNYPDALSAISLASSHHAPILLTHPNALDPEVKEFIRNKVSKVIIVGGKNSVSDAVVSEISIKDKTVTVFVHLNDGSGGILTKEIEAGKKVDEPYVEFKEHVFIEWNTKSDGTGEVIDFETKVHDKDLDVYAIWRKQTDAFNFFLGTTDSILAINFYRDNGPKSVVIPEKMEWGGNLEKVERIGGNTFKSRGITDITLTRNIKIIDSEAFRGNKISKLVLPKNIHTIHNSAFRDNIIENLILPNSLTTIGNNAFEKNKIKALTIPTSIKTIKKGAFAFNNISTLNISTGVEKIEEYGFFRNKTKKLEVPGNVKEINYRGFAENTMEELVLNEGIEIINESGFGANKLTSLVIPNSVVKIGPRAFDLNKIKTLVLPNNLKVIEVGTFNVNELESLVIPDSVTEIKANAFTNNNCLLYTSKYGE